MDYAILIAAIAAAIVSIINAIKGSNRGTVQDKKIDQLEIKIDGRLTELLELTRKSSHAEGKEEERKEEVTRQLIPPHD